MILYLFIFLLCLFLAIWQNTRLVYRFDSTGTLCPDNKDVRIVCLLLFFLACVVGFRYELGGTDYEYYEYFYHKISGYKDFLAALADSEYEVGYTSFVYLCSNVFHLSYNGSLLVEAFIFYFLMYIGLKRYVPNWGIFLMLFLYKMFFYVTFVAMRQSMTVAGFFLIMRYLDERKVIKYYASLILVSTFHYGAILLFVLYPIFGLKITKNRLTVLGVFFLLSTVFSELTGSVLNVVVAVLGLSRLEDKAAGYSADASLNILYTIEYYMLYLLMLANYDKIKAKFKNADFSIMLFLMAMPIVTLFRSTVILVRELPYFYPAYAILMYYIYAVYRQRNFLLSVFTVLCLLGFIKYIAQFDNGHFMIYKSWLFNSNIHLFQS